MEQLKPEGHIDKGHRIKGHSHSAAPSNVKLIDGTSQHIYMDYNGRGIKRKGWVRSIRQSKALTFCSCTDGSSEFQLTIKEGECIVTGELKVGCSVWLWGEDSTTPKGLYEFKAWTVTVIGQSDDSFPIQPKEHSDEFLRTIPELRGRTLRYAERWKVRSVASQAVHDFFRKEGYFQYYTPIITQADCEGAGETFKASTDWMSADLTVSGQLHLEAGMMSLGRVYNFQPCFRAEKSATRKHLSEFWMIEAEAENMDLKASMDLCERLVKHVLIVVEFDKQTKNVARSFIYPEQLTTSVPWPRTTYAQVCIDLGLQWGDDIGAEEEKRLTKFHKGPVFITHYPAEMKPFYMRKVAEPLKTEVAYCFDLIFPEIGELAGGSEREHDHDKLEKAMKDSGMDMTKMQWYLNTRKWGTVPHAGFGLGFERLIMYLTGAEKVHDTIPFPVSY